MPAHLLERSVTAEDALREASKIRKMQWKVVSGSANQAIRHSRYAAEDAIEEAKHTVKQRPLQAMGVAFATGALAGAILKVNFSILCSHPIILKVRQLLI